MAEQARKFGARVAELRGKRGWKQRDLVAEMAKLGDLAINTNQLSRYEHGGAMPGEDRQQWFADALETTVADLHAGPMADRTEPKAGVLDALSSQNGAAEIGELHRKLEQILDQQAELLATISEVRDEQERLRQLQEPGEHGREATGS
jgi:transcriptional regulator with XRE-family HTH domain